MRRVNALNGCGLPEGPSLAAGALLVAATISGCALPESASKRPAAPLKVQAWVTSGDRARLLKPEDAGTFAHSPPLAANITVDAGKRYQSMVGFGASITDSSAWLMQNRLDAGQRRALLEELFGRGANGIGFEFTRLTIGASDFSRHHYSLDDPPDGKPDLALAHF